MATVGRSQSPLYSLWLGNQPHPVLSSRFSEQELEAMFAEDLQAGRKVPLLLASIIFGGMLLAIGSVVLLYL